MVLIMVVIMSVVYFENWRKLVLRCGMIFNTDYRTCQLIGVDVTDSDGSLRGLQSLCNNREHCAKMRNDAISEVKFCTT